MHKIKKETLKYKFWQGKKFSVVPPTWPYTHMFWQCFKRFIEVIIEILEGTNLPIYNNICMTCFHSGEANCLIYVKKYIYNIKLNTRKPNLKYYTRLMYIHIYVCNFDLKI